MYIIFIYYAYDVLTARNLNWNRNALSIRADPDHTAPATASAVLYGTTNHSAIIFDISPERNSGEISKNDCRRIRSELIQYFYKIYGNCLICLKIYDNYGEYNSRRPENASLR